MIEEEERDESGALIGSRQNNQANSAGGIGSMLMNKIGGAVLARAFLPSPGEVKQILGYTDLGIKVQIILYQLSSSLFWSSITEIVVFLFSFLLFFTDVREMGPIFLHIFHVFRGLAGFFIVKKIPNSHELIENVQFPAQEKIPLAHVIKYLITAANIGAKKFNEECGKFLMIYAILTLVCWIFDISAFFVAVRGYDLVQDTNESAFSIVSQLYLAFIFLIVDLYYFAWIASIKLKLPNYASTYMTLGLLGYMKKILESLNAKVDELHSKKAG